MELFCTNIPVHLTEQSLRTELRTSMSALKIQDWTCDKPRTKRWAWITFLNALDGARFLQKHGKVAAIGQPMKGRSRDMAHLFITKAPIFVTKSNRPVDTHTLNHLKHERDERKTAPERDPTGPIVTGTIRGLHCGHNGFVGPDQVLSFFRQTSCYITAVLKFGRRCLTIITPRDESKLRIDINYETIQDLTTSPNSALVTLVLTEPPRFFSSASLRVGETRLRWDRTTSCPHWPGHEKYIARCLVYQLIVDETGHLIQQLRLRDILPITRHDLPSITTPEPYVQDDATSMSAFWGKLQSMRSRGTSLPFPLLFQVQALVWNNYLHPAKGTEMLGLMDDMVQDCRKMKKNLPYTVEAMKKLFQQIPYPYPGVDPLELDVGELVTFVERFELEMQRDDPLRDKTYGGQLPSHQAWVMKAMVTPARILLSGPEAESKNRILRRFEGHADYFIRLQFCDEDGQDLYFSPTVSNDRVYERFRSVMRNGLVVAGRRFSFLGFSHSSLRSHSVWFMAPFTQDYQEQNYDTIVRSLGSFDDIRIPAKCAARIGQAFSETPFSVPIFEKGILSRTIPDVKSRDESRVFSDGVGTISWEAMEIFWESLPMRSTAATCFQVRWGGVKGLLALDSRLKGKVFCIREESMKKFASNDIKEVGICDTASKPLRLMLNRQLIKIMEDMGVDEGWFFKLQNKELAILRAVTATARNTSTFLRYQMIGSNMGLPNLIKRLDSIGIDYTADPFLKTVVEHVVLREVRLLKHKARIPVREGIVLFGIMDETGYLQENEVYVTFDRSDKRIGSCPRSGPAVITRSPALHPGDVRYVNMADPPEDSPLRQHRNCVVFSQVGTRDLPSQLSGGDLDGDLYSVIWDEEAKPMYEFAPADYPRETPQPLDRAVTKDDIADFFINFMKTDVLGVIANRHQILADIATDGTRAPDCITLAGLHSTAVDSSKTGIPVNVREMPRAPKVRPDFLAPAPPLQLLDLGQIDHIAEVQNNDDDDDEDGTNGSTHRYYKSEKVLGKLYRNVDEKRIWSDNIKTHKIGGEKIVWSQLLAYTQEVMDDCGFLSTPRKFMEEAKRIRGLYESAVNDMMWQYSDNPRNCISEVEAFCGFILNKRGSQTRRQRDSSIKLREEIDRVMTWIVKLMRDHSSIVDAASNALQGISRRGDDSAVQLCYSCLIVGLSHSGKKDALRSFKVVAAGCLLQELTALTKRHEAEDGAGGFVGVNGARATSVGHGRENTYNHARNGFDGGSESEDDGIHSGDEGVLLY